MLSEQLYRWSIVKRPRKLVLGSPVTDISCITGEKSSFKTPILIWGLEQQSAINCKWSLLPYSNSQPSDCASDMLQIQLRKWNKGTKRSDTFCLSPSVSLHALSWWVFCALILARGSEGKKNECASKCAGNPQPHRGYAANCDAFSSLSLLGYWAHPSRLTGK